MRDEVEVARNPNRQPKRTMRKLTRGILCSLALLAAPVASRCEPPPPPPTGPFCGGIAGIQCPGEGKCIDNPNDSCDPAHGGADCGGICLCPDPIPGLCSAGSHWDKSVNVCACVPDSTQTFCGGIAGIECPAGQTCIDNPNDSCDPAHGGADCGGICVPPRPTCAGFLGTQCPDNLTCIDDPSDDCDPQNGGADCGGICVPDTRTFCGGIAGFPCPTGQTCIDNPNDGCDPQNGGADCGGICVACKPLPCPSSSVFDAATCACKPIIPPPIKCGTATCSAGQYCCNASCSICAPKNGACTQQVCNVAQ